MEILSDKVSLIKNRDELSVVVLAKSSSTQSFLLLIWLLAWSFCGLVFLYYFFLSDVYRFAPNLLIMLAFWSYFEYLILRAYLWRKRGFEKLFIKEGQMVLSSNLLAFSTVKKGMIGPNTKVMTLPQNPKHFFSFMEMGWWSVHGETISIQCENQTLQFGKQLNTIEQEKVIKQLKKSIFKSV